MSGIKSEISGFLGFNSLQTGKPIQSEYISEIVLGDGGNGFHSLQTGKPIQSRRRWHARGSKGVSIPFKRESLSKAPQEIYEMLLITSVFQFPSNGKAYPKWKIGKIARITRRRSFHSLQTGKPIQSHNPCGLSSGAVVSIPFKRESLSKEHGRSDPPCGHCEVSIPFKRESLSKAAETVVMVTAERQVSIPFKRESVPKEDHRKGRPHYLPRVSIPFKRESVPKGFSMNTSTTLRGSRFHSLQTGTRRQSY